MSASSDEPTRTSPYRGLEPFEERDAAFFFGRERETQLITANLFAAPLTILYGASGVGKSSVLRAGVLPRLRTRPELLPVIFPTLAIDAHTAAPGAVLRGWQQDPLGGLKETTALALYATGGENDTLRRRFQDVVQEHQARSLGEFLAACHAASDRRLMLILDQFEEYSLYHPDDDDFGEQLPSAIVAGDLSVSFLISLREDALAKLDRFKGRIPTLWDSYRRVDHLTRAGAEAAIRSPLREYNRSQPATAQIDVETRLVDAVLQDVQTESVQFEDTGSGTIGPAAAAHGRIETPYLQLVMTRLWEREQTEGSTTLRWATLQDEGGAAEIVRTHLDRVMDQFSSEEQDVAAQVFHRLVTPSGAKIAFSVTDLAGYEAIAPDRLAPILRRLEEGSRRILRRVAMRTDAIDEPRYEIFHDRLGKAILAWRAKRLNEQERERRQRQEAEQRRIAEQTRASFRQATNAAMVSLGADGQATWAQMMLYLVTTTGGKMVQTAADLATLSRQPPAAVQTVLEHLRQEGILRSVYGTAQDVRYEVAHDALAGALLEWHADYSRSQTRVAVGEPDRDPEVSQAANGPPALEFPYGAIASRLRQGRVIPFLGAGASMSARPYELTSTWEKGRFLPSNGELKRLLADQCDFPPSEFERSDIAEIASYYAAKVGAWLLDEVLSDALGGTFTPSATHRFLAEVARSTPLLILTTNYDTLMEQALDEVGQAYDVLAYVAGDLTGHRWYAYTPFGVSEPRFVFANEFSQDADDRTLICRLFGPAASSGGPPRTYVLTEEAQIDWIFWSGGGGRGLPSLVRSRLLECHLLSLGHSARDWSQRALLRYLNGDDEQRRYTGWAVALHPDPLSVLTWQRYRMEVYSVELNEWAAQMRAAVNAV